MPASARWWAWFGLVGIIAYVGIDVVLAVLRPDYGLVVDAESNYGRGAYSWLMNINFVVRGILSACALVALLRADIATPRTGMLVGIWAVTSTLLAFFPVNVEGYPVLGTGRAHLLLAGIGFVAIVVGVFGMTLQIRREGRWPRGVPALLALAIVGLGSLVLLPASGVLGAVGLVERIFLAAVLGWLALVLAWIVRSAPRQLARS
ncbi:DUF998 domain-containing protein [Glaciibacter psychrotolerans]|uniref:Putative membrane protein n=1 Tax=Glaciibacter psychrotolerans TaxID=670054 RepID=A0A7Z0EC60_9MICO|nr:DUF998 domain-containing protein [Leifsonia psychrotolerans]NYJ18314.1 putative membrane protein [Leifsonia psychrotolerans]